MLERWCSTVRVLMKRSLAISLLDLPSPINLRTSLSLWERGSTGLLSLPRAMSTKSYMRSRLRVGEM